MTFLIASFLILPLANPLTGDHSRTVLNTSLASDPERIPAWALANHVYFSALKNFLFLFHSNIPLILPSRILTQLSFLSHLLLARPTTMTSDNMVIASVSLRSTGKYDICLAIQESNNC